MNSNITFSIDAMEPEMLRDELPASVTMEQTGKFVGMGSEMIVLRGPREDIVRVIAAGWGEDELDLHPELSAEETFDGDAAI